MDDKASLAQIDGEQLGCALRNLVGEVDDQLAQLCQMHDSPQKSSALQAVHIIEAACLGVCLSPDTVRPCGDFCPAELSTVGGTGCARDADHFRKTVSSIALPHLGTLFRNRLELLDLQPTSRLNGIFSQMDSVAVRRAASKGDLGASLELRWRYFWTVWIVGPSESMRQAAVNALLTRADERCAQRLREWLGHLLQDACRNSTERNANHYCDGEEGEASRRRDEPGLRIADAASATAVRRLLHAGAIIPTQCEGGCALLLACRSGRTLLAATLLEGGAHIETSGGATLIESARRARAFELAELLTHFASKKSLIIPAHCDPAELWPGASAEDMLNETGSMLSADIVGNDDDKSSHETEVGAWEWLPDTRAAVSHLLQAGCNVRLASECILHHCFRFRLLDPAQLLLEHGVDANKPDNTGLCCMHLACGMDTCVEPACGFPFLRHGPSWQRKGPKTRFAVFILAGCHR